MKTGEFVDMFGMLQKECRNPWINKYKNGIKKDRRSHNEQRIKYQIEKNCYNYRNLRKSKQRGRIQFDDFYVISLL